MKEKESNLLDDLSSQNSINSINKNENTDSELSKELSRQYSQLSESTSEAASTIQKKIQTQKYGIFLITCCNFIRALNSLVTKFTQRTYPDMYHTVPFLFYRAIFMIIIVLIYTKITKEHILWPSEIQQRMYFFLRTNLNFFGVQCNLSAIWYLRIATVQIIQSLSPLVVTIFSVLILNEKFYLRYLIGIICCILGSTFIILNEKKGNNEADAEKKEKKEDENKNEGFGKGTIIGLFFAFIDIFFVSVVDLANKVLATNKVPVNTQVFYVGINTIIYSLIYLLFTNQWEICFGYGLCIFVQCCLFYSGQVLLNSGYKLIDLGLSASIQYTKIVFVLILGLIFLGEKVYWTDILGAGLIVGYMLFTINRPIVEKKNDTS